MNAHGTSRFGSGPLAAFLGLAFFALGVAAQRAYAQAAQAPNPQAEDLAAPGDGEEMVRIRMRDGKRLNASLFFPKNKPRQNLPTILTFFPYLINPVSAE